MNKKIRVLVKPAGKPPEIRYVGNSLEAMEQIINHPEKIPFTLADYDDIYLICGDETDNSPVNFNYLGAEICGTVIFCRVDYAVLTDLDNEQIESIMRYFEKHPYPFHEEWKDPRQRQVL